jgi:hypothetical protein
MDAAVTAAPPPADPGAYIPETGEAASPVARWSELFWAAAVAEARHNRAAATPSVLNLLRIM